MRFVANALTASATGLLLALLPGAPAHAQAAAGPALPLVGRGPASTAYRGPRFPGGPDSLQAALRRVLPSASPALPGPLYLALELTGAGRPRSTYFLPTPAGTPALSRAGRAEAQAVAARLEQLPAWQVAQDAPRQPGLRPDFIVLPLSPGAPAALAYSDELPTFPLPAGASKGQPGSLLDFLRMQAPYPANDVRQGTTGTVYAYFEVSETGTVAQRRIVGGVSPTLDAAVLQSLQLVPNALTPPRQQGRPVRVGYVLPFEYRIQVR